MKFIVYITLSLIVLAGFAISGPMRDSDRFSFKDIKKELKEDSSVQHNTELAEQVLERGVTFQYTSRREKELRGLGATDELISAIYKSIVEERSERRLFREFMENRKSSERDLRKSALEKGRLYVDRYDSKERFSDRAAEVKKELRFLECEFDPSLGC